MSTELAVAIVTSSVGVVVALMGLLAGHVRAKGAEERADKRAEKQAAADLDKLRAEQAHALTLWRAEDAQARQQEIRERLQKDAAKYIVLLGEVDDITAEIRDYLGTERSAWSRKRPDRWNPEFRGRLAIASAALTLYGGEVAEAAVRAREWAVREAEKMQYLLEHHQPVDTFMDLSHFTEEFARAVRKRLKELDGDVRMTTVTTDDPSSPP